MSTYIAFYDTFLINKLPGEKTIHITKFIKEVTRKTLYKRVTESFERDEKLNFLPYKWLFLMIIRYAQQQMHQNNYKKGLFSEERVICFLRWAETDTRRIIIKS